MHKLTESQYLGFSPTSKDFSNIPSWLSIVSGCALGNKKTPAWGKAFFMLPTTTNLVEKYPLSDVGVGLRWSRCCCCCWPLEKIICTERRRRRRAVSRCSEFCIWMLCQQRQSVEVCGGYTGCEYPCVVVPIVFVDFLVIIGTKSVR